jgi:FAD:protein FMN transferase
MTTGMSDCFDVIRCKKHRGFFLALLWLLCLNACDSKKEYLFYGNTMGTAYHIKVVAHGPHDPSFLKNLIDQRLDQINKSMSTYIQNSEISRFNQSTEVWKKQGISEDFLYVMRLSDKLFKLTGGAWDGTVKPLVDLWGFGGQGRPPELPDQARIKAALSIIGFDKIRIDSKGKSLQKMVPGVTVDLASIAKGFGVDQVSKRIRDHGYRDFIVEIGGEVFASGKTRDGTPWKIGINTPKSDAPADEVYKTLDLSDKAVATSGDYRNFIEINGVRYSHILDPRTGYPITNHVASVTILSDNCTFADGLATAVMVLGPVAGLDLINRLDNTEGLIITSNENGGLTDHPSKGFIH